MLVSEPHHVQGQSRSNVEIITDYAFRNHGYIFLALLLLGPVVVALVNIFQAPSLYQNTMLFVGWNQAVITGFLSFKIFSVSKRDSELPRLGYRIAEVEELDTPWEDHLVWRCTLEFVNQTHGRAKIKDVELSAKFDERLLEKHKVPGEGSIASGFPNGKGVPVILDKGETFSLMFQINGFNYLDELAVELDEQTLGVQEFPLMLSEISNQMIFKRQAQKSETTEE